MLAKRASLLDVFPETIAAKRSWVSDNRTSKQVSFSYLVSLLKPLAVGALKKKMIFFFSF